MRLDVVGKLARVTGEISIVRRSELAVARFKDRAGNIPSVLQQR